MPELRSPGKTEQLFWGAHDVGDMYLVVSSVEHIRAFTRHFDDLIRHAEIGAHEVAGWIERLAAGV